MESGHGRMDGEIRSRAIELQQGAAVQRKSAFRTERTAGGGVGVVAGLLPRHKHLIGIDAATEEQADKRLGIGPGT